MPSRISAFNRNKRQVSELQEGKLSVSFVWNVKERAGKFVWGSEHVLESLLSQVFLFVCFVF